MPADPAAAHSETATMVRLCDQLTTALRALIEGSPLRGLGPMEVARTLGVDKTLASRLMAALRAADPIAALSALPGSGPLRQFVRAARLHGADAGAAEAAEAELRVFEQELQRLFGTRTRLDAVISEALPRSRRRHQEAARQAVFRGMALIKGVSIDLASITWIVVPGRDAPASVDMLVLAGYLGIRRLRPTARVRLGSSHKVSRPENAAGLLREFCRPDDLRIDTTRDGEWSQYEISSGPVRRDASADVFLTETLRAVAPRAGPGGGPGQAFGEAVAYAYKRLALTFLVHESVWQGCDFSLRAYDTAVRGLVALPEHTREADRLPLEAAVTRAPATEEVLASSPVPRYPEIIRALTAPLGLPLPAFRVFSGEVVYPVYGSEVIMVGEGGPSEGAPAPSW